MEGHQKLSTLMKQVRPGQSSERIKVQEAGTLIALPNNGVYGERYDLHKTNCTELIDCFTAKDTKHSAYDQDECNHCIAIRAEQDAPHKCFMQTWINYEHTTINQNAYLVRN
jgi:hypothetical protein